MRFALAVVLLALLLAGCGEGNDGGGLDPQPERQSGEESTEFETEDLEAAENADQLVEIYCEGAESEAQVTGCLSHVTEEDVCAQDTDGRRAAVAAYIEETGDDAVCD
jgi:hypothetical protein